MHDVSTLKSLQLAIAKYKTVITCVYKHPKVSNDFFSINACLVSLIPF